MPALKFDAVLDSSSFIASAKKMEAAVSKIGVSGSGGGGSGGGGVKAAATEMDKFNKALETGEKRYKLLESSSKFYEKQPKQLAEIAKQQAGIYNNLSKLATNEQDYSKAIDKRNQSMEKANKLGEQFSAHSQRQFEQLKGLAIAQLGGGLSRIGGGMYNASQGGYGGLNQKYQFDQGLTTSERARTQSQLAQGQRMSGLYQLGNNLQTNLTNGPLGDILALGGAGLPAAGAGLQAFGALKALRGAGGAAKAASAGIGAGEAAAGAAGLAGVGAGAGTVAGAGLLSAAGTLSYLAMTFGSQAIGRGSKNVGADIGASIGLLNPLSSQQEQSKNTLEIAKNSGKFSDAQLKRLQGIADKGSTSDVGNQLAKSPTFQLEVQQRRNQKSDFNQDNQRQTFELTRNYARQEQDLTKQKTREAEDYNRTLRNFAIQRGRLEEDTNKQAARSTFDYYKSVTRASEDYARSYQQIEINNTRFARDQQISLTRFTQDQGIAKARFEQDQAIQSQRLQEDISKSTVRATEDANISRARADQDYARNRMQLERQTARSIEDLNKGLGDSLISIVAPGLSSNKGYQLMKLLRDYNTQKKRIGEDTTTAKQGLDIGYQRQTEDISRSLGRTLQDLGLEAKRAAEDMKIAAQRFADDQQLAAQRTEADALRASQDQLLDSTLALQDLNRNFARTIEDTNLSYTRSMQDLNTNYARSIQDLEISQQDAALQHTRALEDLATSEQRGKEDFQFAMEGIKISADRFARDFDLSIQQASQGIAAEFGVAASDIQNLYQQALSGINSAAAATASNNAGPAFNGASGGATASGSHAGGLDYVPRDGYRAILHQGEMVLTKLEASQYRALSGGDIKGGGASLYAEGQKFGQGIGQALAEGGKKLQGQISQGIAQGAKRLASSASFDYSGGGGVQYGPSVGGPRVTPPSYNGGRGGTVIAFTINANDLTTQNKIKTQSNQFVTMLSRALG